jgi:hypothetical protein
VIDATLTDDRHGGRIAARDVPDGVVARLARVIDELFESPTLPTG